MTPAAISLTGIAAMFALVVARVNRREEIVEAFGDVVNVPEELGKPGSGRNSGGTERPHCRGNQTVAHGTSLTHSGDGL